MNTAPHAASRGFSLVEVTVAIGLLGFSMVALFGLLPVGLQSIRESREMTSASMALHRIAESLRQSQKQSGGGFAAAAPFDAQIAWQDGQAAVAQFFLDEFGHPTPQGSARLVARVEIAAQSPISRASIRLAWPPSATWKTGQWENEHGSSSAWVEWLRQ